MWSGRRWVFENTSHLKNFHKSNILQNYIFTFLSGLSRMPWLRAQTGRFLATPLVSTKFSSTTARFFQIDDVKRLWINHLQRWCGNRPRSPKTPTSPAETALRRRTSRQWTPIAKPCELGTWKAVFLSWSVSFVSQRCFLPHLGPFLHLQRHQWSSSAESWYS